MVKTKRLLLFLCILILPILMACDTKLLNDGEGAIDRQRAVSTEAAQPKSSIRPPVTKYLITSKDGVAYLTNSYTYGETIKIEQYWVKENDHWVFHKEIKEFPLNARFEYYPSGGEFGYLGPSEPKYYILMPDGVIYATRNEIIPITPETIRLSPYYVRETPEGRWYYSEKPIDLPKKDVRIEQVKM